MPQRAACVESAVEGELRWGASWRVGGKVKEVGERLVGERGGLRWDLEEVGTVMGMPA